MNILVTGGAGYIGSILVPMLLGEGHHVTVIDSLMWGQDGPLALATHPRFGFIRGDVSGACSIVDAFDAVIPLAAIVGAPACAADTSRAYNINFAAVRDLVRVMSDSQIMIIPNTNSGYGVGGAAECDEDSPLKPLTVYGRTKVEAEDWAMSRANSVSLRLATVFGASPRMRFDLMVNDFVRRAVRDRFLVLFEPHFRRNFIHVRDVARTFIWTLENWDAMRGKAYNVGLSSANVTKEQLCHRIQEHVPDFWFTSAPIGSDPDKRDYVVSNARLEATGWKAGYSLEDGIRELVKVCDMVHSGGYGNV